MHIYITRPRWVKTKSYNLLLSVSSYTIFCSFQSWNIWTIATVFYYKKVEIRTMCHLIGLLNDYWNLPFCIQFDLFAYLTVVFAAKLLSFMLDKSVYFQYFLHVTYCVGFSLWWKEVILVSLHPIKNMMTSADGNIFCITGSFAGNPPVNGEFHTQKPVM